MTNTYDVVIIGGGAAGENVAGRTAPGGLSTVIVESELVGGECTYWACMPSKALLRPAEVFAAARRVPAVRDAVTGNVDAAKALRSRDAFANRWDDRSQVDWVASVNADLIRGVARLDGTKRVVVDTADGVRELIARKAVVLATGSHAAVPPIDGIDGVGAWTSRDIVSAKEVPESLVILGGGPVGVEMAQAWKSLGTGEVTLIERKSIDDSVRVEPFAMRMIVEAMEESGIRVLTEVGAVRAERHDGVVSVTLDSGEVVSAQQLVIATGRRPNTESLGLETVGLTPGSTVEVDDTLQAKEVDGGWLYAVGDLNGRALLTHQGKYQARQAGDHILGKGTTAWAEERGVASVIFTDPQIGSVGLTERQARERGINVRAVELEWNVAGITLLGQNVKARAKFVVDEDRGVLVGTTFVGPGAGEHVHAATIAIVGEVSLATLWHTTPSFPTASEIWLRFLERYGF
jgi:pyruvate/2-oxoglutarate dehydrogenase complex dihydrolipoamide dehydrogenase (E3) component